MVVVVGNLFHFTRDPQRLSLLVSYLLNIRLNVLKVGNKRFN